MKKALKVAIGLGIVLLAWKAGSVWIFKREPLDFSGEKKIGINDNGFQFLLSAKASTVGELFEQSNIEIGEHDVVFPANDEKLISGMKIDIARALPVTIDADGKSWEHFTFKQTVDEALHEAGVTLSHLDKTKPEKNSGIEKDLEIVVTRINVEEVTKQEPIEFETIEKK